MENILKNIEISGNSATCYKNNNIIFKNASIKISNGEVCIIMGPNGCGKTTFIKCLCKIHDLESGEILINNIDIQDEDSNFIDNILYIGHKNSLNDDLSVIENLEYFCAFDSTARFENFNKTKEAMKYFDIYKYKNYLISDLSEGNKKKISLARLIMSNKKIWLLDEPLSFLDENTINNLMKVFSSHQENGGIIISSSHYDFSSSIKNYKFFKMNNQNN